MKITIDGKNLDRAPEMWLKQAGYHYVVNRKSGEASFIRPLGSTPYPQFHIYIHSQEDKITFNLHLDQKKPSYEGSHAHNGEYEGRVVEEEVKRLKSLLINK